MDQPLVSIIIPAYNSEKYLAEAISSALDQTWPNKELLIIDDGSTDGTLAIARKFESDRTPPSPHKFSNRPSFGTEPSEPYKSLPGPGFDWF